MATKVELEQAVKDAETELTKLTGLVESTGKALDAAIGKRDRAEVNTASAANLKASEALERQPKLVQRAKDALEDFGKQDRRDAVDPLREAIKSAAIKALEPFERLITGELELDGIRFDLGFRQEGKLNATGPSCAVVPYGKLFKRVSTGGGRGGNGGKGQKYDFNGKTAREYVETFGTSEQWEGVRSGKVGATGAALRVARARNEIQLATPITPTA